MMKFKTYSLITLAPDKVLNYFRIWIAFVQHHILVLQNFENGPFWPTLYLYCFT